MEIALRGSCVLVILICAQITAFAEIPSPVVAGGQWASDYVNPKTTFRAYIKAVRSNDLKAAKECWVIDDDNKSGALDTIVGMWISMRRFNQAASKQKLGITDRDKFVQCWKRDDLTDEALNLTEDRLVDAKVKTIDDVAELKIKWQENDRNAFWQSEIIHFRKVNKSWKIDANRVAGIQHGADFFQRGTWGPLFRDLMVIFNEATDGMEKGKLNTLKELETFLGRRIEVAEKASKQDLLNEAPKGK